ncbi:MAG: hypothetical protein AB8G77_17275 [Rhodothermales bacterium]
MENILFFKQGEELLIEEEAFVVLKVTDLGTEDVQLSSFCQWGTHILTLERSRDGKCYAATRYASGEIGAPFPFKFSENGT